MSNFTDVDRTEGTVSAICGKARNTTVKNKHELYVYLQMELHVPVASF